MGSLLDIARNIAQQKGAVAKPPVTTRDGAFRQVGDELNERNELMGYLRADWKLNHCASCGSEEVHVYDDIGGRMVPHCEAHSIGKAEERLEGGGYVLLYSDVLQDRIAIYKHASALKHIPADAVPYSLTTLDNLFVSGKTSVGQLKRVHAIAKDEWRQGAALNVNTPTEPGNRP